MPSAENDHEESVNAAVDGEPAHLQTNFERLISHLPANSLAASLVTAYAAPSGRTPQDAVRKVAATRLEELKKKHDHTEDTKA